MPKRSGVHNVYTHGKFTPPKEAPIKGGPIGGYAVILSRPKNKPKFDRSLLCDDVFTEPNAEGGPGIRSIAPEPVPAPEVGE